MSHSLHSLVQPNLINLTNLTPPTRNLQSHIHIRVTPSIDKAQLQTLITHSIQSLFGKCQLHFAQVLKCRNNEAVIRAESVSVDAICAALTMSSTSPITNALYCIDIVKVKI